MSSSELMTVDAGEALCLGRPQVGCQVVHRFGPGIYIRECLIPSGVFVIGHRHKYPHVNIMLAGSINMRHEDEPVPYVVTAPHFYVGKPGRKLGEAIADVVWQNIFATEETDVEKLEARLFDKSPAFLDLAGKVHARSAATREDDRNDFHMVLDECNISPYQARAESEREGDQIPMPEGWPVVIRKSAIDGLGVFLTSSIQSGQIIGPARLSGKRAPAGRFANHSRNPNAKFVETCGDAYLVALSDIAPFCSETVPGDEVTVDYRQALSLAGRLK